MARPNFVTEIDVSGAQSGGGTWVDVSSLLRELRVRRGASDPQSAIDAAEAEYSFDNRDGTFDDENVASILAGFTPGARIRTYADDYGYVTPAGSEIILDADNISDAVRRTRLSGDARARRHLEFWESFEATSGASSTGWSSFQGDATHGLTLVTNPVRHGAKAGRFEVRNGDVFASGERSEVLRTTGYGTGTVVGQEHWVGGSTRLVGPFTHAGVGGFELFHQQHGDDARFAQAPLRLQKNDAGTHWEARLVSGNYATLAAALAGTGGSTDLRWNLMAFEDDVFFDWRYGVLWTVDSTGWLVFDMKQKTDSVWTRFVEREGIQTLGSITGDPTAMTIYGKWGLYRTSGVGTQVVVHDGIRVGHCPEDLELTEPSSLADGSMGIWLPTTNLHPNGGAETNTSGIGVNGAGVTVASVARAGFFGNDVVKLDMPGTASSEAYQRVQALTTGLVYTWQALIEVALGERVRIWVVDPASATLSTFTFTGDGIPRLVSGTFTATTTGNYNLRIGRTATGAAMTVYIDGAQIAQRAYPTPYVETDGAAATRNAGGAQAPADDFDETQMWLALRLRHGFGRATGPGCYGFLWGDSTSALLGLQFDAADKKWKAKRLAAGAGAVAGADTTDFQPGDYGLIVFACTATAVKVSVNGRAFVSAGNTNIPTLTATLAELGSGGSIIASQQLDGDVMWAAWGRGTLADADVADLYRRFGRTSLGDPRPTDLLFPAAADVRSVWSGADETYWTKGPGYIFSGFTDDHPETWPAQGHDALAPIRATDALTALSETPVPTSKPDFDEFSDVLASKRPTFYWTLNDPEGTKVRHHTKKKRVVNHFGAFIVKHRTTHRVTRSEVEGYTGPPGTYKNTPLLGEPGLIVGSLDTSVRFRRAQSEYIVVPLDDDSDSIDTNLLTVFSRAKLASLPAAASGQQFHVIWGPENSASAIPSYRLWADEAGKWVANVHFSDGTTGSAVGATALDLNAHTVGLTWDGTNIRLYLDGVVDATSGSFAGKSIRQGTNKKLFIGANSVLSSVGFMDGWLAHIAVLERSLSSTVMLNLHEAAALRGWNQELADARIAHALDEAGLWSSYSELEVAARQIQPVRQGGQEILEPIRDAELVDSGRFFIMPSGAPRYLAGGWRERAPWNVPVMTFGDFKAFTDDPTGVVPYREVALVKSRDQLILEARVTRVGSDETQVVTSSEYSAGQIKPTVSLDVLTIDDAAALAIANELVDRYELPQKRVEALELVGRDETWPAFFLDVGDRVLIVRNPPNAPQKSLDAHVESVELNLNPSGEETLLLGVSPR